MRREARGPGQARAGWASRDHTDRAPPVNKWTLASREIGSWRRCLGLDFRLKFGGYQIRAPRLTSKRRITKKSRCTSLCRTSSYCRPSQALSEAW